MNTLEDNSIRLSSCKTLPAYRSTRSLEAISRYLFTRGIGRDLLLAGSGVESSDLDDPDALVTHEQEFVALQNVIRMNLEPGLGLSIGKQFHIGILGVLGTAAINSDTFLDAEKLIYKYSELLQTYFHYDMVVKDDLVYVTASELVDMKEVRVFMCEREFASVLRIAQDLLGSSARFLKLHIAYPKPTYVSLYQEMFQCPVIFNKERHVIISDKKILRQPLPLANPLLRKTYERECIQLSQRIKGQETILNKIQQEMLFQKNELPSFDKLARFLAVSPRTLRRRLTAEGTSYKDLVSKMQKKKALNLLQSTSLPISEIASRLGYSDLANFYRAFKKWTGLPPGNFRLMKPGKSG